MTDFYLVEWILSLDCIIDEIAIQSKYERMVLIKFPFMATKILKSHLGHCTTSNLLINFLCSISSFGVWWSTWKFKKIFAVNLIQPRVQFLPTMFFKKHSWVSCGNGCKIWIQRWIFSRTMYSSFLNHHLCLLTPGLCIMFLRWFWEKRCEIKVLVRCENVFVLTSNR